MTWYPVAGSMYQSSPRSKAIWWRRAISSASVLTDTAWRVRRPSAAPDLVAPDGDPGVTIQLTNGSRDFPGVVDTVSIGFYGHVVVVAGVTWATLSAPTTQLTTTRGKTLRQIKSNGGRRIAAASMVAMGLVAAACGSSGTSATDTKAKPPETKAPAGDTTAPTVAGTTVAPPPKVTTAPVVESKPVVGGKIVIGVEAETSNPWTPAKMQCDVGCQLKIRTVYEPLAAVDESGEWRPYLAEAITPNADATEWTIKLRSGVTFHDGTPVTAAIDNFNRALNSFLVGKALTYVKSEAVDGKLIADITKVDDLSYTIKLLKPWWRFPVLALSGQSGFLASPKWLAAADADPTQETKPVGTGPFQYDSYAPGNNFIVKKNPTYWQKDADGVQLPYLDQVEFRVIQDATSRGAGLRSGDLDMLHTTNGDDIAKFRDEADQFPMTEADYLGETAYTLMHVGKADSPLADKRVRCAIAAATDAEAINEAINAGITKVANGPFSPTQPGYLADTGNQKYDPDMAKKLLDEYVAEKGSAPKLIYTATNDQNSLTVAEIVQSGMNEAGFDASVQQIEQGKLITNALLGDPSFDLFGWRNHGGFLDNQFIWWHKENALPAGQLALNFGRLNDPVINDLLEKARGIKNSADTVAIAEEINRQFAKECWIVPTYWTLWAIPHKPEVVGFDNVKFPGSEDNVALGQGFPGSFMLISTYLAK
jgi:peptide/nickel transport system substrate-binding protein